MTLVEEVSLAQDLPWRTQQLKRLAAWLCLQRSPPMKWAWTLQLNAPLTLSQTDCFLIELMNVSHVSEVTSVSEQGLPLPQKRGGAGRCSSGAFFTQRV